MSKKMLVSVASGTVLAVITVLTERALGIDSIAILTVTTGAVGAVVGFAVVTLWDRHPTR